MQNGMLPVAIPQEQCRILAKDAEDQLEIEVDLVNEVIRRANGEEIPFSTDPFRRHCLVNGLDDIALTLQAGDAIGSFEKSRSEQWPWLDGFGYKGKKIPVSNSPKSVSKTDW
jgi:3-isopropylmalate dehydratase